MKWFHQCSIEQYFSFHSSNNQITKTKQDLVEHNQTMAPFFDSEIIIEGNLDYQNCNLIALSNQDDYFKTHLNNYELGIDTELLV